MSRAWRGARVVVFALCACGPAPASSVPTPREAPSSAHGVGAGSREGETIWRAKCGSCHTPVEPGTRVRADLEVALQRHRKRVRLTEAQWSSLLDFLAPPSGP